MKAFITKVLCFLKHIFLSLHAVVSLRIGKVEESDTSDQDTEEKEDIR